MIDLHLHTTASDGRCDPPTLVRLAWQAGLRTIARAGGVASLAHPGLIGRDALLDGWAGGGLAAIEVHHSEHTAADVTRYLALARRFGLAITGGSDYHGDDRNGRSSLGTVSLPAEEFAALEACVTRPAA